MANQVVIPVIIDDKGTATLGKISGGLDQVGAKSKQAAASMSAMWSGAAAGAAVAGGAFVALGAGFAAMAAAAARAGGAMADIAQKTGLSVEAISSLELAAKASGSSMDAVAGAVNKMQKAIVGGSDAFKALGINLATFKTLAPEKQFAELSRAILSLKTPAEQTAAAMAIFGKAGADLLPVMKAIAAGAGEMSDAIGGSLSGAEVQSLDALDDALTGLSLAWDRLQEHFVAALNESGLLSRGIDSLSTALGTMSNWITQNTAFFHGLSMALRDLVSGISAAVAGFQKLLGLRINPDSFLARLYGTVKQVGQNDMMKQAEELAKSVTAANKAGIVPGTSGSFSPGDAEAERAAAAEREAIWRAESTAIAQELAERTREYQKHYDAATDAALKSAEEQIKAEREIAEEQIRAQQDARKGVDEMGKAISQAIGDSLQRASDEAREVGLAFQDLGETMGGAFGSVIGSIGTVIEGLVQVGENLNKNFSVMQKIAGVASGIAAAYRSGSVLGGAAKGAAAGAMFGPVGAGIGAVVGGILGFFGKAKKKAQEAAAELARVRAEAFKAADALVEMGQRLDAMRRAFLDKAVSSLPDLFKNFASQADTSQAALDRLSRLGAANFAALRAAGLSVVDAMKQMAPALEAAAAAARATGNVLTGPMAGLADFARKVAKNEDLVNAVSALNDQIAAMRALGMLTQDMANDVMGQMAEQMAQLTAAGFTTSQSLALMAPALYQLAQAQAAGTVQIDAATQALIDQAQAAGLFEGMKDPMAQLVELQQAMLSLWIEIAKVLGAQVPAAAAAAARAIGNIPATPGTTPGGGAPREPGDRGRPADVYAAAGYSNPSLPRDMTIRAHRGESVVIQPAGIAKSGGGVSINLGGIHGVAGTPEAIGRAVTEAIERGAVPRLRTALREVNS